MLGGDVTRAITRGVEEMVAVPIRVVIEEPEKVRLTDGVKKRVKSAHMKGDGND